jgi:sterol desaturase/sphingolipid hydroxylase (fatty acid hydroxylase superfamily)
MKPDWFLDFVAAPVLFVVFLGLAWLQRRRPLRNQHFAWLRRCLRNLVLSIPSHVVLRWAMLPLPISVAAWARNQHVGVLNWIQAPVSLRIIAAFLMMDYAYWWWHWANHRLGLLWRFHNVHHTDLDMDVSTATRFHFGEMIFSVGFLCLTVTAFGVSPMMLMLFFASFEAATLFHHSNLRLPIGFERILAAVLVTPRMHGIHHSIVERETNSNWGTIFCWWDKLHGTLRRDIPQDAICIGVAAYREERELTVGRLLALPFGKQRPWQLPNGDTPDRKPRAVDELSA